MQRYLSSSFWLALFLVCGTAIARSLAPSPTLSARGAALQAAQAGQIPEAPASPGPDDRYKADILVIVAHPDDETMVTAYLAKAIFDEHKRVAVISRVTSRLLLSAPSGKSRAAGRSRSLA